MPAGNEDATMRRTLTRTVSQMARSERTNSTAKWFARPRPGGRRRLHDVTFAKFAAKRFGIANLGD